MTSNVSRRVPTSAARNSRTALADALIEELTGWSPPDRLRAFTKWHRGSLSLIQLIVLTVLETDGPLPMRRLAEALDVSDASATGIVDRIEKRGLVERRHGTEDRREVLVQLTDRGGAVFHDLQQRRRARIAALVDQLADDELGGLLTGLRAMRTVVQRMHENGEMTASGNGTDPTASAIDAADAAGDGAARGVEVNGTAVTNG